MLERESNNFQLLHQSALDMRWWIAKRGMQHRVCYNHLILNKREWNKALVKRCMIVNDSWGRAPVWPPTIMHYHCTIIDYHQLSFTLNMFKIFVIVDDSFSRLTTRMIVHDSLERLNYYRLSCTVWPGLNCFFKNTQRNTSKSATICEKDGHT